MNKNYKYNLYKYFYEKDYLILILLVLFIFVILQICLFEIIIPNITNGEFKHLGLLKGDASYFHQKSLILSNHLKYAINYGFFSSYFERLLDFTSVPINIKILSIFYYLFGNDPISIIYLNSIFFLISIVCIYQISKLTFKDINNCKLFFILACLVLLFFPSFIYIFNSTGKEAMTITIFLVYLTFLIRIKKNYNINLSIIIIFIFTIILLQFMRPHYCALLFLLTLTYLIFNLFNFSMNKKIIFNITKLILSFLIVYLVFTFFIEVSLEKFNQIGKTKINKYIEDQILYNNTNYIINYTYSPYIFDFIENEYIKVISLRNHFIQYNLSINSNTLISTNLYNDIYDFFIYLPILLNESILIPYPFWSINNKNEIFSILVNFEMVFMYSFYIIILINIKKLNSFEIILIFFMIFSCSLLFFVNPNIGTYYRIRQPFNLFIILISLKYLCNNLLSIYRR